MYFNSIVVFFLLLFCIHLKYMYVIKTVEHLVNHRSKCKLLEDSLKQ
jgi:hypothetical protein